MDVGKLPNHINIVLCVWLFFFGVCFLYYFLFLTGWEFELIPYMKHISKSWRRRHSKLCYWIGLGEISNVRNDGLKFNSINLKNFLLIPCKKKFGDAMIRFSSALWTHQTQALLLFVLFSWLWHWIQGM